MVQANNDETNEGGNGPTNGAKGKESEVSEPPRAATAAEQEQKRAAIAEQEEQKRTRTEVAPTNDPKVWVYSSR